MAINIFKYCSKDIKVSVAPYILSFSNVSEDSRKDLYVKHKQYMYVQTHMREKLGSLTDEHTAHRAPHCI